MSSNVTMSDVQTDIRSVAESKGGVKFDLVLSDSPNKPFPKFLVSSPAKRDRSLSDIERKLQAAERRRLSQKGIKHNLLSQRLSRVSEVQRNKNSFIRDFKRAVRENHDRKMKVSGRNRAEYLDSIKQKNKNEMMRVNEIKNTTLFLRQSHFNTFCRKFETSEHARQAQFKALEEHLSKQDSRMEHLRLQIERLIKEVKSCSVHERKLNEIPMDNMNGNINYDGNVLRP
ncbi:stathmin-like [Stegodyphus dumicola]|uniref:stathmin-like n=1 Tax=Stegodyphus dumicola TaxID=202533 RepID=UPI0015AA519F|nr:stathmin-like [Stegodyphus dumicola]